MAENEVPARKTGWQAFWTDMFSAEVQLILATVLTLATIILVAWLGLNEPARMREFTQSYEARSIENGGVIFRSSCAGCHAPQGQGIVGVAPALNTPTLFNGERLDDVGWSGSLRDFVQLTVSAGRPTTADYPNPMPTWSQEFGGPLRPDEVEDVVNFVLNWEETALSGAAPEAAEAEPTPEEGAPGVRFVGTDMETELPEGDPVRGQELYESDLGCVGCHVAGADTVAPALAGIAARSAEREPGVSAEVYMRESILLPEAYAVEGYEPVMSALNLGDRLTLQDVADLIAYMLTQ